MDHRLKPQENTKTDGGNAKREHDAASTLPAVAEPPAKTASLSALKSYSALMPEPRPDHSARMWVRLPPGNCRRLAGFKLRSGAFSKLESSSSRFLGLAQAASVP